MDDIEKCFNAPAENALRGSQLGLKYAKNKGTTYWILTLSESVLSFQVKDVCAKFCQNQIKIVTARAWIDRHTEMTRMIICPMLCYSNGRDNHVTLQLKHNTRETVTLTGTQCILHQHISVNL